ncbi:hypothetical protein [Virgibacillus ihumii]|uniref:hypothetical protein n=1 Tax=Virgibacillus ihumii TaxID=2686091 RepID=UPI00157C0E72|nr:hypothetical protein [Virgibacillus ihumii]
MNVTNKVFSKIVKDKPFHDFQQRFKKVLNNSDKRAYVLELSNDQLKQLYDGVLPSIETSIYAEMEYVMVAISTTYNVILQQQKEEVEKNMKKKQDAKNKRSNGIQSLGGHKFFSLNKPSEGEQQQEKADISSGEKEIQKYVYGRIKAFMGHGESFQRFVTHVVTNYQSLQKQRIDVLMIKNAAYQTFESTLFDEPFIVEYGFKEAYQLHNQLVQAFHTKFDELLFTGEVLDTDEKINEQVIDVILRKFESKIA